MKSHLRVKAQKYMDGDGVDMDPEKAVQILLQGVQEGDIGCYYDLALSYFDGVPEDDPKKAISFLEAGANAGHGKCCASLSELYKNGTVDFGPEDIVKPNAQISFEWCTQGANNNDPSCLINMAHYHLSKNERDQAEVLAKKCLDLFEDETFEYEDEELDEIHALAQKLVNDLNS